MCPEFHIQTADIRPADTAVIDDNMNLFKDCLDHVDDVAFRGEDGDLLYLFAYHLRKITAVKSLHSFDHELSSSGCCMRDKNA